MMCSNKCSRVRQSPEVPEEEVWDVIQLHVHLQQR